MRVSSTSTGRARRAIGAVGLSLGLAVAGAAVVSGPADAGPSPAAAPSDSARPTKPAADSARRASARLREAVTVQDVRRHLRALQLIADANDGTRASGTPGYAASRDYIVQRLRAAGYKPQVQRFEFEFFAENSPTVLTKDAPAAEEFVNGEDFLPMTYSGSGEASAPVEVVDTDVTPTASSTSGCEAADFAGFTPGSIALIQRGTCDFRDKALNAEDAGASAVIIFNRGTEGFTEVLNGTLGSAGVTIPVVGASFAVAESLAEPGTEATVITDVVSEIRPTWNVTAETRGTNDDDVVMAGAHLDSVPEGPGINDNGSGSASLLAVAEKFSVAKPKNTVRFAWWGAEELGLLGADNYVADLKESNPEALLDISLYLNFDMVGSPNFARFVYDGDNSAFGEEDGATPAPAGSDVIERRFVSYFDGQGLATAPTAFDGRSDYGPFIAEGIPSGGLFTGAEGIKTPEEEDLFGGESGVAYDECYHQACDTTANVDYGVLDEMTDAIAHATATFSWNTAPVTGGGGSDSRAGVRVPSPFPTR